MEGLFLYFGKMYKYKTNNCQVSYCELSLLFQQAHKRGYMNIIKRDGRRRKFNPTKIVIAIQNALIASNTTFTDEDLDKISDTVIETVQQLNKTSVKVEEINTIVEKELMEHYPAAAKNFILFSIFMLINFKIKFNIFFRKIIIIFHFFIQSFYFFRII